MLLDSGAYHDRSDLVSMEWNERRGVRALPMLWLLLLIALTEGSAGSLLVVRRNDATESPDPATTEGSTQQAIDVLNERYAGGNR